MARGTDFGGVHSDTDLHLIQQLVDVQPAEPRLNLIDIPGADGAKDLSTQPGGRVVYKDRKLTWTFALYPGDKWAEKHRQVSGALNGKYCRITLDSDQEYYFLGRLAVKGYKIDNTLRQITVEASCRPYMLRQQETEVRVDYLSTAYQTLRLVNDRKPTIPVITVTAETTLLWKGSTITLSPGTHKVLDIELLEGVNQLDAKVTTGTGSITLIYQEGAL